MNILKFTWTKLKFKLLIKKHNNEFLKGYIFYMKVNYIINSTQYNELYNMIYNKIIDVSD